MASDTARLKFLMDDGYVDGFLGIGMDRYEYSSEVAVDGDSYDEIACEDHVQFLHRDSDLKAPGIKKYFISSTVKEKRGVEFHA